MKFEVKKGCFGYASGRKILNDITFSIKEKEILSILGSNGVGKTTLLKCTLGLLEWNSGQTLIDNKNIVEMTHRELWQRIGYVPQAKLSTFAYTVDEMVLLGRNSHLKMLEQPGKKDKDIAKQCIEKIGIGYLKGKLCSKISGGELQMVLIARALAAEPNLLILDEPESNLDFKNQLIVLETIKNLRDEEGISSIVNTHYPAHAITISNKALILNRNGTSSFGEADSIIVEHNLQRAFGVNVKIEDVYHQEKKYTCVLPISIA
jgi:iron complex transport system ATP-binding protein